MDVNLILTAQTLTLAPHLRESSAVDDMLVVKNIPAKTYLRVTKSQWALLQQFRQPRTVPVVFSYALEERLCPPLSEFFELILKAVRANILLEPNAATPEVKSRGWRGTVRAEAIYPALLSLFLVGTAVTLTFRPALPQGFAAIPVGLLAVSLALSVASAVAASVIRGAGGEIYRPHWRWLALPPHFSVDRGDAIMLDPIAQRAVAIAPPALLATVTGLIAWHRPEWNLIPLLALLWSLRPVFGGHVGELLRFGRDKQLSDAERDFIFPPNVRPGARWRLLIALLRLRGTWLRAAYSFGWLLVIAFLAGRLAEAPPWKIEFWRLHGTTTGIGLGAIVVLVASAYFGREAMLFARTRASHRRQDFRQWRARWFGDKKLVLDEQSRIKLASASPLFRTLPTAARQTLARSLQPAQFKAWQWMPDFAEKPARAGLIASGKVGLYRVLPSGRTKRVHVLCEGDVVGLHDLADPARPLYRARALTPVTLLALDRPAIEQQLVSTLAEGALTNIVLKRPFLRQVSLCRNWHPQAIDRFAQLSAIIDCTRNATIVEEGSTNHYFFVILEDSADVMQGEKRTTVIDAGEFFGEIGLLQNSSATSSIVARHATRCLSIARNDFLRFVTHNHLVALELERVSSKRLGGPIFPLKIGNFRTM